ncbi:fasciclin domain-containing protein, partial [bacterium]|nr:fasciclin domain-containing protein [bacterium]
MFRFLNFTISILISSTILAQQSSSVVHQLSSDISSNLNTVSASTSSSNISQLPITSQLQSNVPFWSEDFSGGIPSSWTNSSVPWEFRGPNTSPNNSVGSQGAYVGIRGPIQSPTTSNGFVIFDSDYYDNGGVSGAFGTGIYPANGSYMGTLTTPSIDCSIYPNITLKFNSFYREYTGIAKIAFSLDGGVTYTDTVVVHPDINLNEETTPDYQFRINLPSNIAGQPSVHIQFIYDATIMYNGFYGYYFWMIDDIELVETPNFLLECSNEVFGGSLLGYQNTGDMGFNYTFNPLSQASNNPYRFEAIVSNFGASNQDGVKLNASVENSTGNVYNGSSSPVTINSLNSDTLATNNYFYPYSQDLHVISIWADSDSFPSTDTSLFYSIVSDTVYAIDYDFNSDGSGLNANNYWEIGSSCGGQVGATAYEIYNTNTISSISFHVGNNSVVGAQMKVQLYENLLQNSILIDESYLYTLTSNDIGNWVTIPLQNSQIIYAGTTYMAAVSGEAHPTDTFSITVADNPYSFSCIQDNGCNLGGGSYGDWYTTEDNMAIRMNLGNNLPNSIYDIISFSADHNTLTSSVNACGLDVALSGSGPFTLFAPTDAAFNLLPQGLLSSIFNDIPTLTNILLHHVVGDSLMSSMLSNGQIITTLAGTDLTVTVDTSGVYINGAQVTVADVIADNGVVHVIDAVLMPILGCMDPTALNYDSTAIIDNGTCLFFNPNTIWSDDCSNPSTWIFTNSSIPSLDWNWTNNTDVQSQMITSLPYSLQTFNSATATNGFMIINSDAAPGNADQNGTPIVAEFTNAFPVDLTGYQNVQLTFQHSFRWWNDTRGVRVSGDNGASWTDFEISNVNTYSTPNQDSDNPHISTFNISSIAGNQSQVLVQFYYDDNDYWAWYWTVDDVAIEEITNPNLQIYTNDQCGEAQNFGWELQDSTGFVVANGGINASENWSDFTYYNYSLPIDPTSCDLYDLVLYDYNYCSGWNICSPASVLITLPNGDTLFYQEGGGGWCSQNYSISGAPQGCTDPSATNYDTLAQCDDGSCCYLTSTNLQIYTNDQCGMSYGFGWELQDSTGSVVATGGFNSGESWSDYTYYDYCLPIDPTSCDLYDLVLYDNNCYGWYACSPASALITSSNGDTLLYREGSGGWCSQNNFISGAPQGCTDPSANNYDALAQCDDGSCCYGSSANLQIYTNDQCGMSYDFGWELQDSTGSVVANGGFNSGE